MKLSSFNKPSNSFAGNVFKLLSGTVFAQVVSLIAAPFLTRLYAPEAYGTVALFGSLTGIIGVVACLRYELAIMLPEGDHEAANILGVSIGFTLLISSLMIPLSCFISIPISSWLNTPALAQYFWLVPLTVLMSGIFSALNFWNSRTRHFGRLSISRVTSSLTATPLMLGLGFWGYTTAGSMIGSGMVGQAIATSFLGIQIWREDGEMFRKNIQCHGMKEGIKRYKKFPIFDSWAALINTVSVQLPPLLIAFFFSAGVVGFYSLGHRLLSIPMSLIGGAISQVFFQHASVAKSDGTLPLLVRNTFKRLMSIGSFPILLVMLIGEELFSTVFGNKWGEAGIYAQILAPWLLFVFFGSPISTLFSVLEIQGLFLVFNTILLATRVASLVVGGLSNSIFLALSLYSGSGTAIWIFLCVYMLWKAGLPLRLVACDAFQTIFIAAIASAPVVFSKGFGVSKINVVIIGCLSSFLYYTILYFRDEEVKTIASLYFGKMFRSFK